MRTLSNEEWLAFLAKSKQQKLQLDVVVDVNTQLVVGDADSSMGVKRKRRNEKVKPSEATSSQGCGSSTRSFVNLEANEGGVVDEALCPPSAKKSTCNLRSRVVGRIEIPVKACSSGDQEIEVLHVNMPET
ncbi:hypothetical protein A2U01_0056809, partial [Trifolium medium]|nr:hypothetical protein [Trifolium medium]